MKPNKEETRQTTAAPARDFTSRWVALCLPRRRPCSCLLRHRPCSCPHPAAASRLVASRCSLPPHDLLPHCPAACWHPAVDRRRPYREAGWRTNDRPCLAPWHWWLGPWLSSRPSSPPALSLCLSVCVTVSLWRWFVKVFLQSYTSSLLQCFYYLFTLILIANFNFWARASAVDVNLSQPTVELNLEIKWEMTGWIIGYLIYLVLLVCYIQPFRGCLAQFHELCSTNSTME